MPLAGNSGPPNTKSQVVQILVNLRQTAFLTGIFLTSVAEAAPGDNLIRDLAGRVGPVVGSALACPEIARPRVQSIVEKFASSSGNTDKFAFVALYVLGYKASLKRLNGCSSDAEPLV